MSALPSRALGNTGMDITTVGLGAWAIGGEGWEHAWGPQDDAESIATIREAVAAGVNWLDTAPIYGLGHSEEVVGEALAGLPANERPYVFTKCGLRWDPDDPMGPQQRDARAIRWEVEQSLRRLRVERLDLLQVHWPPLHGPALDDYWQVMVDLKAAGVVRAVGLSNHDGVQVDAAEKIGHVDSLQPPLSLLRRDAGDVIGHCAAQRTGVIVYSPMESGLLSGSFTAARVAALPANDWRRTAAEYTGDQLARNLSLVDALRPIATRHEASVAAVAVAWTLAWPGVTGAIVGARRTAQIGDMVAAARLVLSDADLDDIATALGATGAGSGPVRPTR
ncbi:MAG TPA: aldo/keto reductase [Micromonosporaceae bacterium]|nr:aldo/keto reductase [Micromonosporaceae bacterium]